MIWLLAGDHISSDPAVKQILLILDKMPSQGGFIIKDIDDTHVLVRADDVKRIRIALEQELELDTSGDQHDFESHTADALVRIALEPARKAAPPPPPPPAKGRKTTAATTATTKATPATAAKNSAATTTKKAVAASPAPATRTRLTEKERATRDREKEREKIARAKEREKEREKARKLKEREKEHERKEKAKAREDAKKEREKIKAEASKAMKKPYPPPPKGPNTAYLLFTTDRSINRDRGEGVADDAIKAGQAWRALSDAEREVYSKKAEQARTVWKEEIAKWVSSLNLAQLMAARANREPGTRGDAAMNTLPKRPGNAYALFLADVTSRQDFRDKIDALVSKEGAKGEREIVKKRIGLYGRATADIWKSMSEKERAVYSTKAAEAKAQWDKKFGHLIAAQKEEFTAIHP
ncbi:unnamed protein product [Rhizoctonia solani]|uniref:RNA polymerase II transcription factor B subunit 5 n=1 Tax=Rhizoctonia solani TaxID=456999 RepID=A0A8H2W6W3_9AGAM|nr:unnamed protein product [Rhizoctonia solani]